MILPNICEIQMGYTLRERLEPVETGGVPAIQLGNLTANDGVDTVTLKRYPVSDVPNKYLVRSGDVLFRSRGERNTAVALDERLVEPALPISPLIVLRPIKDLVLPTFLEWILNQPSTQTFFDKKARGTSLRMIPRACLDELEVTLPDIKTQRLIVEIDRLATKEKLLSLELAEKRRTLVSLSLEAHVQNQAVQRRN